MPAKLFLIPTPISEGVRKIDAQSTLTPVSGNSINSEKDGNPSTSDRPKWQNENLEYSMPPANKAIIDSLDYFIVENIRSARRFLAGLKLSRAIDQMRFAELNEHTPKQDIEKLLQPLLKENRSGGILSEAGLPCVADPGSQLVAAAHRHRIEVIPLVGPSSIMLALMASGANGQSFSFNGYLPVKQPDCSRMIGHYEKLMRNSGQTQIFIETPYRNLKLFDVFLSACSPQTLLTVAAGLTGPEEYIRTFTIAQWTKTSTPDIDKRPAIFILSAQFIK